MINASGFEFEREIGNAPDTMLAQAVLSMRAYNLAQGDKLVITAGIPFGSSGTTNLIQVHEIKD